ncbi:hypothetical protein VSAK1_21824 [Vibrio mediterranei AK1]|nr:hypothetical protein VSAK1_21824 [Vibrio mediterranei AK1]
MSFVLFGNDSQNLARPLVASNELVVEVCIAH